MHLDPDDHSVIVFSFKADKLRPSGIMTAFRSRLDERGPHYSRDAQSAIGYASERIAEWSKHLQNEDVRITARCVLDRELDPASFVAFCDSQNVHFNNICACAIYKEQPDVREDPGLEFN